MELYEANIMRKSLGLLSNLEIGVWNISTNIGSTSATPAVAGPAGAAHCHETPGDTWPSTPYFKCYHSCTPTGGIVRVPATGQHKSRDVRLMSMPEL